MEIKYRNQLIQLLMNFNLPLIAVECGVAGGSFSEELLQSGMEKVYSIDIWEYMPFIGDASHTEQFHESNYKETVERLSKYGDRSVIIKDFTHRASKQFDDNSIGLIYHDGCHDLICVGKDLEVWYPKLVEGGIFALHDYGNDGYGVSSAVNYFCTNNNLEIHIISEDGHKNNQSAWFQKKNKEA